MKSIQGFTLAELLVTIAIGALILSTAVPGLRSFVLNNRQAGALNEMIAMIQLARSESITRNARVTVCATAAGATCEPVAWGDGWMAFVDEDGDRVVDAGEDVRRVTERVEGFNIASAEFPAFFVYRPNGRLMVNSIDENSGELVFCDSRGSAHARVVAVSPSGRPQVQPHKLDGSAPVCP